MTGSARVLQPFDASELDHSFEDFIRALCAQLEHASVDYCVLRGLEAFPRRRRTADIDWLVAPRSLRVFERVLAQACLDCGVRRWRQDTTASLRQYYLCRSQAGGRFEFLQLDVHASEVCLGVPILQAHEILPWRTRGDCFYSPAPSHSALINFLGPYLAGGMCAPGYYEALVGAAGADEPALFNLSRRVFGARSARAFTTAARNDNAAWFQAAAPRLRLCALLHAFLKRPLRSCFEFLRCALSLRLFSLFRPRGLFLAFLGPDGSGKSALVERVQAELSPYFNATHSRVLHFRPGWLPPLARLLPFGDAAGREHDRTRPHAAAPSGRVGSVLRLSYYWIDFVLGYFVKIAGQRRRHALILFDRYFDDYFVDARRSRIDVGVRLLSFYRRFVPKPEHVFICHADVDTIQARKQELSPLETARQLRAYVGLATGQHDYHVIDTTAALDDCLAQVLLQVFGAPHGEPARGTPDALRFRRWFAAVRWTLDGGACSQTGDPFARVDPVSDDVSASWRRTSPGATLCIAPEQAPAVDLARFGRSSPVARALAALPDVAACERFALLPATAGAFCLLDMQQPAVFRAGLQLLPRARLKWRVLRDILALASYLNLHQRLGLQQVALVRKGDAAGAETADRGAFAGLGINACSGVPGAHQKILVQVVGTDGKPRAFVKAALTDAARRNIADERDALAAVALLGVAPDVYRAGALNGIDCVVLEALGGRPGAGLRRQYVELLVKLASATGSRRELVALECFCAAQNAARGAAVSARVAEQLEHSAARLRGFFRPARTLRCARAHADFTPWNVVVTRSAARAFDWEFSRPDMPALFDLFHYVVRSGVLVQHDDPATLFESVQRALVGVGRPLVDLFQLSEIETLMHFELYLHCEIAALESTSGAERPAFIQFDWLRYSLRSLLGLVVLRSEFAGLDASTLAGRGERDGRVAELDQAASLPQGGVVEANEQR